ncbi:MAG: hypothetical protein A2Y33_07540 [Spirochaetes bacterium GWF1_51_8]|nr:MAG: hypothetical protein A2Y33_07540 [Spirochaetes bacterium GWF1_51_8]
MNRIGFNFVSYIMLLYQSGLIALGRIPNPLSTEVDLDIEETKSILDLLEMLKEKTAGNLDDEEIRTLDMVSETLRNGYIEELSKAATENKDRSSNEIDEGDEFEVH